MDFWTKIKKDLQKGYDGGIAYVKEGAAIVMKKAGALTEEGKRLYLVYELKSKVQKEIADLGGHVYDLSSKVKNPMLDSKVKESISRIKKLETEIQKQEGTAPAAEKKAAPKKVASKKPAPGKAPAKKAPAKKVPAQPAEAQS